MNMKWWTVNISTAAPGPSWPGPEANVADGREVEYRIRAADTKSAARVAIDRIKLRKGELLHVVHVGRPGDKK